MATTLTSTDSQGSDVQLRTERAAALGTAPPTSPRAIAPAPSSGPTAPDTSAVMEKDSAVTKLPGDTETGKMKKGGGDDPQIAVAEGDPARHGKSAEKPEADDEDKKKEVEALRKQVYSLTKNYGSAHPLTLSAEKAYKTAVALYKVTTVMAPSFTSQSSPYSAPPPIPGQQSPNQVSGSMRPSSAMSGGMSSVPTVDTGSFSEPEGILKRSAEVDNLKKTYEYMRKNYGAAHPKTGAAEAAYKTAEGKK